MSRSGFLIDSTGTFDLDKVTAITPAPVHVSTGPSNQPAKLVGYNACLHLIGGGTINTETPYETAQKLFTGEADAPPDAPPVMKPAAPASSPGGPDSPSQA